MTSYKWGRIESLAFHFWHHLRGGALNCDPHSRNEVPAPLEVARDLIRGMLIASNWQGPITLLEYGQQHLFMLWATSSCAGVKPE
ncbi:hypothetical protein CRG98_042247 [Punica granatum]|uniref:Uncharacterized protein n=1 Tax=Punica granatum TaxID=22663 RepID=A0A2I0I0U0_PUNGR|nr:hypothetical protein CRG98_042247 [Punica granatum]